MSFYDYAALAGGSSFANTLSAAASELYGGWEPGVMNPPADNTYNAEYWATTAFPLAARQPGIQAFYEALKKSEGVVDDTGEDNALKAAIGIAFVMDSAMMTGSKALMTVASGYLKGNPDFKKLYNYIRRKIHAGSSKRTKLARGVGLRMRATSAANAAARRAYLANSPWYGSDPWVGRDRAGAYKYLYNRLPYAGKTRRSWLGRVIQNKRSEDERLEARRKAQERLLDAVNSAVPTWIAPGTVKIKPEAMD